MSKTESTAGYGVYEGTAYRELAKETCEKARARQVCLFVLDGSEGPGVARHNAADSQGQNFIQDAVDAKYFADGLRQIADLYELDAKKCLALAKRAGQEPTKEQLEKAGFLIKPNKGTAS